MFFNSLCVFTVDGTTSASLSTLQSCVSNSIQAGRSQGPEISTKLSKYFRADLITHVTNWAADQLEKQVSELALSKYGFIFSLVCLLKLLIKISTKSVIVGYSISLTYVPIFGRLIWISCHIWLAIAALEYAHLIC